MTAPNQPAFMKCITPLQRCLNCRVIMNLYMQGISPRNQQVLIDSSIIKWVTSNRGSGFLAVSKNLYNMIMLTVMTCGRKLLLKRLTY